MTGGFRVPWTSAQQLQRILRMPMIQVQAVGVRGMARARRTRCANLETMTVEPVCERDHVG
jgi:hypothetical protein